MHRNVRRALLPFLAVAVSIACSKAAPPEPSPSPYALPTMAAPSFKVMNIEVGRAVGADKRISAETDSFKPKDTIYVSVETEGTSPGARLAAHWTYQDGQVVKDDETSIAPSGRAATEFHISKPGGWPVGDYKVEVMLDGVSAGTKSFKVSK